MTKRKSETEDEAEIVEEVPTCAQCGATEFKFSAGDAAKCAGCGTLWHTTDLVGERFEFLKDQPK